MLDNEFDKIFRDRLLDHPSKVRQVLWKQVHTHLVRHTAFWKWYFVGPSAVAAVVTSYFLVTAIRSSAPAKHPSPATAVATYNTRPNPDPSATAAAPAGTRSTDSSATASPATPNSTATSATTTGSTSANSITHRTRRHSGNSTGNHRGHRSGSETESDAAALSADAGSTAGRPTGAGKPGTGASTTRASRTGTGTTRASSTRPGTANTTDLSTTSPATAHPPIPAELTAPAKLATLKTRPDIAAATTNPKKPQQLTLPARRSRKLPPLRVDAFGAPEYFTARIFGFSYGAGARVTVVYKKHFTLTTGVQYLRVNVKGTEGTSGASGTNGNIDFPSGYIHNVHLPLLLGYTTGDDRFTFSAHAGVLFSLYAHSGGEMTYTGAWSNRDGASAYLGLNFASHVTSRISVFAEPYVKSWDYQPRHQFLPFTPSSLPNPAWSVGLMVGVRYDF